MNYAGMSDSNAKVDGYSQITICIDSSQSELFTDFLTTELPAGFQEIDSKDASLAKLRFYLDESLVDSFRARAEEFVQERFSESCPEFEVEFVANIDWQEKFRRETKAVIVADTVLVRPTWVERESVDAPDVKIDIVIDPKMAFGVGSHETTQLAMCALKDAVKPGQRVADIGCGSLILSILAAKLGASYVKAVDNDPVAIVNGKENQRLNNVSDTVEISCGSTDSYSSEHGTYNIVVANIISKILLELLDDLLKIVKSDGMLILSGIMQFDAQEIESALRARGVMSWSQSQQGAWVCYCCSPSRK